MPDEGRPMSELVVSATAPGTDLTVYDWRQRPVAQGRDQLTAHLPAGLYKVYTSGGVGSDRSEVVDLQADTSLPLRISNGPPVLLPIAEWPSAAATAHAAALDDAMALASGGRRRSAGVVVMLRRHLGSPGMPSMPDVTSWFTLLDDAREAVAAFDRSWKDDQHHGYALTSVNLPPGSYTLRTSADSHPTEQSLVLAEGWRTLVVISMTVSGVFSSLASVIMCPIQQTWNSLPEAGKLMSESVFSALRTGRPAISWSRLVRAAEHPEEDPVLAIIAADPVLAIIAANQLLGDRGATTPLARVRDQLIGRLSDSLPGHPDVQALARCLGADAPSLTYPPMLTSTYAQLLAVGVRDGQDVVARGSYAEHAGAASMNAGIWLAWPSPAPATQRTTIADAAAPVMAIPFVSSQLEWLVKVDGARKAARDASRVILTVVRWVPIARRWARILASKLASWDTAALHRAGMVKIAAHGSTVAALRRGTTALTLTRLDPTRVALAAGVPQRLAATIRQALTTRLGGTMSSTDAGAAAKAENGSTAGLSRMVIWAALAILAAFGGLVAYMLISASSSERVWQRQMYVFASVEAIVFAAAGALFGVEVKRQEAAKAVQVADRAIEEAEEAKKSERQASEEAQRGRSLAATARGLAATPSRMDAQRPDVPGARGGPSSTSEQDALHALANVANELFPPDKRG